MKKLFLVLLLLLLIPFFAKSQSDTSTFRAMHKEFGVNSMHKNVTWSNADEILVVTNDSIFYYADPNKLTVKLRQLMNNSNSQIVSNQDSIKKILSTRIKVIIYFEPKKTINK